MRQLDQNPVDDVEYATESVDYRPQNRVVDHPGKECGNDARGANAASARSLLVVFHTTPSVIIPAVPDGWQSTHPGRRCGLS